ncbi:MAG: hypothetical protein NTW30_04960, partial [Candidatus Aenigmarchaeota archaeon]|nr:hypothetical protein [Candidatus Aenigmarchaeota archaeon]
MPLSPWYADFTLPGSNAQDSTPNWEDLTSDFSWGKEPILDKVSYYNSCLDSDDVTATKTGLNKSIFVNGVQEFVESDRKKINLFPAIQKYYQQSSLSYSSESSVSSSLSSWSSSYSSACSTSSVYSSSSLSSSLSSACSSSSGVYAWMGKITLLPGDDFNTSIIYDIEDAVLVHHAASTSWELHHTELLNLSYFNDECGDRVWEKYRGISFYFIKEYLGEEHTYPPISLLTDIHQSAALGFISRYDYINDTWSLFFTSITDMVFAYPQWTYKGCCEYGYCYYSKAVWVGFLKTPSQPVAGEPDHYYS